MPLVQQVVQDALATHLGEGAPALPVPPPVTPQVPAAAAQPLQRIPTTNPPGGLIHAPQPYVGAVQ